MQAQNKDVYILHDRAPTLKKKALHLGLFVAVF